MAGLEGRVLVDGFRLKSEGVEAYFLSHFHGLLTLSLCLSLGIRPLGSPNLRARARSRSKVVPRTQHAGTVEVGEEVCQLEKRVDEPG